MARRVLISGGAGFLGVNAAAHMAGQGWHVTVLDNLSRAGTHRNLAWLQENHGASVEFVEHDLRHYAGLDAHLKGQDAIVHLAGQVAVTTSLVDPIADFEINARGTLNLLETTRLHSPNAAFVFASTNKVYGQLPKNNVACKETQPIDFHSPYGCSKGAADQYVRDYARCFHMNTVVLRQSCIYGAHQYGTEVRDLLDARDLSRLYQLVIERIDNARGEIYNAGGGPDNQRNLLQVIEDIGRLTEKKPAYTLADWREGDQAYYVSDITKLREQLGWEPQIQFDKGLRDLVRWAASAA